MIYITGDTHGCFERIECFCQNNVTTTEDILIILGDAGINYYGGQRDIALKEHLSKLPITLFCIHGNHENRPQNIDDYKLLIWNNGLVNYEKQYPNILFPLDGEVFRLNEYNCLVIGGAYSVDKGYRLQQGWKWWEDEQPNDEIKSFVEEVICDTNIDIILSHTCPRKYEPTEAFLSFIEQDLVDKSTEDWLEQLENKMDYKKWYCGHYHITKKIDKLQFMFKNIEEFHI